MLVGLTACASLPNQHSRLDAETPVMPAAWLYAKYANNAAAGATEGVSPLWWTQVGDPTLTHLVQTALSQNLTLAIAAKRVDQARIRLAQTQSNAWPKAQGQVGASAQQALSGGAVKRSTSASVSVSWELDLWQRLAAQNQVAQWQAVATEADKQAVAQSLVASVVRSYWQWAYAQQRVDVAQANLVSARQTLQLLEAQYRAGAVSGLARAQAQQVVSSQEASVAQWQAALVEARETLALLMGQAPQGVPLPAQGTLPAAAPATFAPGLPASVLACRPDVYAAQARLQQAWSQEEATARQWYPALSLTGSISGSATTLADVLSDPLGALSSALTLPFLQWRELARQDALAQADADIARMTFHDTVFKALSEVDKNLALQKQLQQQWQAQRDRLDAAKKIAHMTHVRYDAGAEPLRVLLDAQQTLRQSELDAAQASLNMWTQWVDTMLALGQGACQTATQQ